MVGQATGKSDLHACADAVCKHLHAGTYTHDEVRHTSSSWSWGLVLGRGTFVERGCCHSVTGVVKGSNPWHPWHLLPTLAMHQPSHGLGDWCQTMSSVPVMGIQASHTHASHTLMPPPPPKTSHPSLLPSLMPLTQIEVALGKPLAKLWPEGHVSLKVLEVSEGTSEREMGSVWE